MGALDMQVSTVGAKTSAPASRNLQLSPDTFGAGVGEAVTRGGAQINDMIQADIRRRMREDSRVAGTAYNRAVAELGALEDSYSQTQMDEASKQFDVVKQKRDEIQSKYTKDLTPEQSALFGEDFGNAAIRFDSRVSSHRAKQEEILTRANQEGRLALIAAEAARSGSDPHRLAELNAEFDKSVAASASEQGIPAGSDAEKAMVAESKGKFHASVVSTMLAADDLGAAKQYLDAYGDEVPVEVRNRITNAIQAAWEAEAPFKIADAYERDMQAGKTEEQVLADIREKITSGKLKASVGRGAMAEVRSRGNARAEASRQFEVNTMREFLASPDRRRWAKENADKFSLIQATKPDAVASALTPNPLPLHEQVKIVRDAKLHAQASPDGFLSQYRDRDGHVPDALAEKLGSGALTDLYTLIDDVAANREDSDVSKQAGGAIKHVTGMVSADFKKDPEGEARMLGSMHDWGVEMVKQGKPVTEDMAINHYKTVRSSMVTAQGDMKLGLALSKGVPVTAVTKSALKEPEFVAAKSMAVRAMQLDHGMTEGEAQAMADLIWSEDSGTLPLDLTTYAGTSAGKFSIALSSAVAAKQAELDAIKAKGTTFDKLKNAVEGSSITRGALSRGEATPAAPPPVQSKPDRGTLPLVDPFMSDFQTF